MEEIKDPIIASIPSKIERIFTSDESLDDYFVRRLSIELVIPYLEKKTRNVINFDIKLIYDNLKYVSSWQYSRIIGGSFDSPIVRDNVKIIGAMRDALMKLGIWDLVGMRVEGICPCQIYYIFYAQNEIEKYGLS